MTPDRAIRIVFAIHPGAGHVNSSLCLAKLLRERGHHVIYLGLVDARESVLRSGFEFVPLAEDILPGAASRQPADSLSQPRGWWARRAAAERLFRAFLSHCSNGELDRRLLSCMPDLVLCDTLIWYVALRAISLGLPTANLSIFLAGPPNAEVPPLLSPRIPRSSSWGRILVRSDWLRLRCNFFFTRRLASLLFGRFRTPYRINALLDEFHRLARRTGFPCRENRTYWLGHAGPQLILPEIVLCPRAFDFPQAPDAGRCYLGALVEAERSEDTTLLQRLDREKPLVYSSLGSDSHLYPHSAQFFRTFVEASRLRPDWQWVLSVGPHVDTAAPGEPGPNLLVVNWAPQMAMLQRAAVMVTHGGINSLLECLHFAVPMVVVPAMRDQPGNMARAIYHGIALGAKMNTLTAVQLIELTRQAMQSAEIRDGIEQMRNAIAAENGLPAALELLESLAATPRGENP